MYYGYTIRDGKGNILGDEGGDAYFSSPEDAMYDALDYANTLVEDASPNIPTTITIEIDEIVGEGARDYRYGL